MSDSEQKAAKKSIMPLLMGGVLALVLGGGGFYATYSGMISLPGSKAADTTAHDDPTSEAHGDVTLPMPEGFDAPVAFVKLSPIMVSLSRSANNEYLRFEGNLEVDPEYVDEVTYLMPRIMDVINSYLRAVELTDLRDPSALIRLRIQMLRRIQIVTGQGRVRDLLVTTFLIS